MRPRFIESGTRILRRREYAKAADYKSALASVIAAHCTHDSHAGDEIDRAIRHGWSVERIEQLARELMESCDEDLVLRYGLVEDDQEDSDAA